MTGAPLAAVPRLVESLARAGGAHRVARKLVVAPNAGAARELLRRLSLVGEGWVGFEVITPRPLALRLAAPALAAGGLTLLDAFDEQALLDAALDFALSAEGGGLGALSEGVGFRERVHEAVRALRLAGIGQRELDAARLLDWRKRRFVLGVLRAYERALEHGRRADTAMVLRLAATALEGAAPDAATALDADVVLMMPGLSRRGWTGRLVTALTARGAQVLETDPVLGLEAPEAILWASGAPSATSFLHAPELLPAGAARPRVEFFRAASVNEELREVLRRIAARGLRWDQAEIVTPAPSLYGSALHALATRLEVPVTYAVGLPIERTRTGRVVRAYLDWIEEGFQASPIRRLLEAGDLRPPRARRPPAAAALARRFRGLRIGWGRARYRTQLLDALAGVDHMEQRKWERPEAFGRRRETARAELKALEAVLFPTLRATPSVPDRMGAGGAPVSAAQLARGLRAFLRRVPKGTGPDRSAHEEVTRVLERVEATLRRRTDFRAAVTILRRHLELRVRTEVPGADDTHPGAPWSSEGGSLHLSDLEHGGFAGRDAVFLVGFDAEHMPGADSQDPVLLDADRRALGTDLPTSSELMRERIFRFAALFARLRGSITMSYGAWDAAEARAVGPSPVLLRALRLARGDATLTFEDLRDQVNRVVCAVPARPGPALDVDDVWMEALGGGEVMRAGVDAVRASFARLDVGLTSRAARAEGPPAAVHGVVEPRPDELDPRRNASLVVSASRLEALGRCPLKYLQQSVLRIRAPDDPELDPDRWLDPLRRGGLMHGVYETTLRGARSEGLDFQDAGFEALALRALSEAVERVRREVPAPGEGAQRREIAGLEDDVRSFVRMVRDRGAPWVELELRFGLEDDEPMVLDLAGGPLRLRGAIDRVDEVADGLHVIDYKTGSPFSFGGSDTFDGGRRLQHALYARAAEARRGARVSAGEYHFPTRKGENQSFEFGRLALEGVTELLEHMLDGVAQGRFVPTDQADDCAFCDFAEICRVRTGDFGKVDAPLADWSEGHLNVGLWPAFEHLKRVRTFED